MYNVRRPNRGYGELQTYNVVSADRRQGPKKCRTEPEKEGRNNRSARKESILLDRRGGRI